MDLDVSYRFSGLSTERRSIMKKGSILLLAVLFLVGTRGIVLAQNNTSSSRGGDSSDTLVTDEVEIRPLTEEEVKDLEIEEAKKKGGFRRYFQRVGLWWTFDKEKRIKRALELAEERFADIEAYMEENPEKAEKAREQYENFVEKAEKALEKLEEKGDEKSVRRFLHANDHFEMLRYKVKARYDRAYEQLEKKGASKEKFAKLKELFDKANSRIDKLEEKFNQKRDRLKARTKERLEKSDDETDDLFEEIEEEEGLKDKYRARLIQTKKRIEHREEIQKKRIEEMRERLENSDLSEEEKEVIKNRLERTKDQIEEYRAYALKVVERRYEGELRVREDGTLEKVRTRTKVRERIRDAIAEKRTDLRNRITDKKESIRDRLSDQKKILSNQLR